jgi:hypothetical protein
MEKIGCADWSCSVRVVDATRCWCCNAAAAESDDAEKCHMAMVALERRVDMSATALEAIAPAVVILRFRNTASKSEKLGASSQKWQLHLP